MAVLTAEVMTAEVMTTEAMTEAMVRKVIIEAMAVAVAVAMEDKYVEGMGDPSNYTVKGQQ